ncbi:MAG: peptidase dimerization domain-containing protein [Hymenobacter sp.]
MTVTQLSAGTQHNVVPDECRYVVDIRSNECYSNEEILTIVRANVQAEVTLRSTYLQSSGLLLTHPLVQKAVAMGKVTYGSPTLSDQALMRFPTLKMGPGDKRLLARPGRVYFIVRNSRTASPVISSCLLIFTYSPAGPASCQYFRNLCVISYFVFVLAAAGLLPAPRSGPTAVYCPSLSCCFPMPTKARRLATGDGTAAGIGAAIRARLAYRRRHPANCAGLVQRIRNVHYRARMAACAMRVLPREAPELEQAVLVATSHLPRFVPGREQGQAVAVRYTLSVGFAGPSKDNSGDGGVRLPPDWDDVEKWVPYPPRLSGGQSFNDAVYAELQRHPAALPPPTGQPNHVRFAFTVDKTGQAVDLLAAGNADLAHNQAAFQALRRLPRFEPGRDGNNQPVAVRLEEGRLVSAQPGDPIMPVMAANPAVARPTAAPALGIAAGRNLADGRYP